MSMFALFLIFVSYGWFHESPQCKHGIHMHVIWQSPECQEFPGEHAVTSGFHW
jgi:hypothetical protein